MINSEYSHYLSGPCEGVSIHRSGCRVWVFDAVANERYDTDFPTEDEARSKCDAIRADLYALAEMKTGAL